MATEVYLYMGYQALFLVKILEWCIYALYISDRDRISKHCLVDSKIWHAQLAITLDGYLWTDSSLVTEKIQIGCLAETHIELITPLLTSIHVGSGCEGYSSYIFFPAKSELTSNADTTV